MSDFSAVNLSVFILFSYTFRLCSMAVSISPHTGSPHLAFSSNFELRRMPLVIYAYYAYFIVERAENNGYNLRMEDGE